MITKKEGIMLIDSHAHLDMKDFDKDREDVIERAIKNGLTHIVTVGIDLDSSVIALDLARKHDFIYSTVGYHPHNADECDSRSLDALSGMASDSNVVAWGEIGLDFYRGYSSHDGQIKMFSRQLDMAHDLNVPVIIHDREAHSDVLRLLKKIGKGERKGVIHCFSGDTDLARDLIDLGYFISIPGTVTYKNASQIKAVAAGIPLECMLVETDAPFLAPVPKRGKRNEPLFVTFTALEIARLRGIGFDEVALQTSKNAKILFGLP
jgi:TatD DNase family protein